MNKSQKNTLITLLILFILLAVFVLLLEIYNYNKIILGARVGNAKIGGMKTGDAKSILNNRFNAWLAQEIKFIYQDKTITSMPEELGITIDPETTLLKTYNLGRKKNVFVGLIEQVKTLLPWKNNIPPVFKLDEEKLAAATATAFQNYENPAKYASLAYNSTAKNWDITPAQEGYVFDRAEIKTKLLENIENLSNSPVELNLIKDYPEVLENKTENAKNHANQILKNAPYYLVYNDKKWPLDRETLIDWLDFVPIEDSTENGDKGDYNKILGVTLDQEKIQNVLMIIAPSINQETINATLAYKDGKIIAFSLPREGIRLDLKKSAAKIADEITKGDDGKQKSIEFAVKKIQPLITSGSVEELGLTTLLGKGVSNFAGSPKNRMHNIKIGAARFNGTLIKPGEEFSFNEILGEVGPKQGYLPELVIKQNKTIPEYGGGICQVSTTAFRAAINSGLKITERFPHAFPVKYYNPQGFDATIYPPHPDLRFINDTPKNILVQTKIEGTIITFEFYGTSDGREVKIKGPTILAAYSGGAMKTLLVQEIWRDGKMERKEEFYSNYKSPALYPTIRNPLE